MTNSNELVFVTGNEHKAAFLAENLGIELQHQAVDVPEIQSLDIEEVLTAKVKAAYTAIGHPVLVEDVALYFHALGRLPGTLTKWFEHEIGLEKMCRLLDPFDDRAATVEVLYGLFNGVEMKLFRGKVSGRIADHPRGQTGWGFDQIFIHDGMDVTRAELSQEEWGRRSHRTAPLVEIRQFLKS